MVLLSFYGICIAIEFVVLLSFFGKLVDNLKQTKNEGYTTSINVVIVLLLMSYRLFQVKLSTLPSWLELLKRKRRVRLVVKEET